MLSEFHAGVVERAIRTIKTRLYKYFTQYDTTKWVDVITKIIDGINASKIELLGWLLMMSLWIMRKNYMKSI